MDAEKLVMIEKILKLLELGKDDNGAYSAERDAANQMAAKLMEKHSLDFADLRSTKINKGMFQRVNVEPLDDKYCEWESSLASAITHAFDCHIIHCKKPTWIMRFCGTKQDIEISVFFYESLVRTVGRKAEIACPKKIREQDTFAYGMVQTIAARLNELYKIRETIMASDSKALMVVKNDMLKTFIADEFPRLKRFTTHAPKGSMDSYNSGREAGKTVNLSRPVSYNGGGQNQSISAKKH